MLWRGQANQLSRGNVALSIGGVSSHCGLLSRRKEPSPKQFRSRTAIHGPLAYGRAGAGMAPISGGPSRLGSDEQFVHFWRLPDFVLSSSSISRTALAVRLKRVRGIEMIVHVIDGLCYICSRIPCLTKLFHNSVGFSRA
jgi:hypothetical protein